MALGTVERNTVDVAQAVKDIATKMPDAVVQISAYKSCAAFIREARKAGFGGTFFNVSFVGTQALADELGKEGRGIMVSQVMPFPFSTTTGRSRASTSTRCARPAATRSRTTPAWKATWPRRCSPKA